MGFFLRWIFAFLLLAATINPTPYNYLNMLTGRLNAHLSIVVLCGLVLLVGYIIYLRATLRSIGAFGMALILALFAALLWVAVDLGLINLQNPTLNMWIALVAGATVLGVGLYWSHIRRALSGQSDMDDIDE